MIVQLDSEQADLDLTSFVCCLTDTPDASNPTMCQALVYFGDGAKDLDGTGGTFKYKVMLGSQEGEEVSFTVTAADVRLNLWTDPFPVPANTEVKVYVYSPNAADSDVDVTAKLYDAFPLNVSSGVVEANIEEWLDVAVTADTNDVPDVNVTAMDDNVIAAAKIATAAFAAAKFANGFLTADKIADSSITRAKVPFLTATTGVAEITSMPAVDASVEDKVQWIYQLLRNQVQWVDNGDGTGEERLFNDAGVETFDRAVAYDGDGYTKNEWGDA